MTAGGDRFYVFLSQAAQIPKFETAGGDALSHIIITPKKISPHFCGTDCIVYTVQYIRLGLRI